MTNIRLFLARHGNTFNAGDIVTMVGARTDLKLTNTGLQQAVNLAAYFKNQKIDFNQIYCGQLARQRETAQYYYQSPQISPALNEIDYGPWEGLTDAQIHEQWPQIFQDWSEGGVWPEAIFKMPFEEKQRMLRDWIDALKLVYQDQNDICILAISSNGIIRLILSLIPDLWEKIIKEKQFKNYKIKTGHFCELLIKVDSIELIRWNGDPLVAQSS